MSDETTSTPEITLNIKGPSELKLSISISPDKTVGELKQAISEMTEDCPKERQRLIYSGKVLKDDDLLTTYKLATSHTVHLVKGAPKASSATGGASSSNTGAAAFGAPPPQRLPTLAAGQGSGPMAALEGVQGHGIGGGMMNPFAGMGNLNDPNAMADMMQSPAFLDQMGSMLQNPEVVDQIIASNPQLAGMGPQIRTMLQSEQFRSFLSNPNAMRQMMQMQQMMGGGGYGGLGGAGTGSGGAAPFPPPGAFGQPPAANAATGEGGAAAGAGAAPNPFSMFGGGGAGGGGAPPMPTPEQMAQMQAMFGGGGSPFGGFGGAASRPAADTRPAHERFANQLEQLQGMGFYDGQANIEALTVCGGNVSAAVEYLFSHPPSGGN